MTSVGSLIRGFLNSQHNLLSGYCPPSARSTNSTRCSRTSIRFHGIASPPPRSPKPAPKCKPSPETMCKGCHGTEHPRQLQGTWVRDLGRSQSSLLYTKWENGQVCAHPEKRCEMSSQRIPSLTSCQRRDAVPARKRPSSCAAASPLCLRRQPAPRRSS